MISIFRRSPGRLSSSDLIQKSAGAPVIAAGFFEAPDYTLPVATMGISTTLVPVNLIYNRVLTVSAMTLTPTFNDVALKASRRLAVGTLSTPPTFNAVGLLPLTIPPLSVAPTFNPVALIASRRLSVAAMTLPPTFNAVTLTIQDPAPADIYEADSAFITYLNAASAVDMEPTLEKESTYITELELPSTWQAPQ